MTKEFCGFLLGLGGRGCVEDAGCMVGAGPGFSVPFFVCKSEWKSKYSSKIFI